MSEIPLTRKSVTKDHESAIRDRVRNAVSFEGLFRLASVEDTAALTRFLSDPAISQPIYTLPEHIDEDTTRIFIQEHLEERERGEGLLMIGHQGTGFIEAYYDFQIWPQWSTGKLGGAIHKDLQSSGRGGADAKRIFSWMFEYIGVDLICETCAVDNLRSARLLKKIGFSMKGKILSELPEGGTRPSLYWELEG